MAIARQRPATANGIVFMLLEDEHGLTNLVVQPEVYERHRALVRGEPLLAARGRLEKVGLNINVVVTELESLAPLARELAGLAEVRSALPQGRTTSVIDNRLQGVRASELPRAPPHRLPQRRGLSARSRRRRWTRCGRKLTSSSRTGEAAARTSTR